MRLLVDTNALLWLLDDDARLGTDARQLVTGADDVAVSVASLWEIAIKVSLHKLAAIPDLGTTIEHYGLVRLDITDDHLAVLQDLPHLHGDPFDRLIVAQAMVERRTIVTSDETLSAYDVRVLDARR